MIELGLIIDKIPYRNIVLATDKITDPFIWYFFIVLLIVGGIIAGAMLLSFSRKPDDWEHNPAIDETYVGGRLDHFTNSLKSANPIESNDDSLIRNRIQNLFYEKLRAIHGISVEELMEITTKDKNKLRDLIKDKEITDWILNIKKKEKISYFDSFRNKKEKKQDSLSEYNKILDKMEVWGE